MKRLATTLTIGLLMVGLTVGLTACMGSSIPRESNISQATNATEGAADGAADGAAGGATEGAADGARDIKLESTFGELVFNMPVGLEYRVGASDKVYITEQPGRIVSMSLTQPEAEPQIVLDITDRVYDKGGEQGLLGVAFHPNNPSQAYVNYTTETHTIIARFDADPNQPELLDSSSEQILLTFKQPYSNHNGGQLAFGPDGYLYIATGDGGSGGDPRNNGQNLNTLLGKILRVDVDAKSGDIAYAIPADNPFIEQGAPEIYAYGLRNPWRFSFDEQTGLLWAADVGQDRLEEVNLIEKGGNYGWSIQEGTECFNPKNSCDTSGLEQPLYTYGRDTGVSITGGYVYRGERHPELVGWYVYSDYGTGTVWALRKQEDGSVVNKTLLESGENITSFGRDASGELYVSTQEGRIYSLL